MKEQSKEELLEILEEWFEIFIDAHLLEGNELVTGEQAYKQIRKLIKKKNEI